MKEKKFIHVQTQFIGFHKYENSPGVVRFLRNLHRHLFYVKVKIEVFNVNRELEFYIIKYNLDNFIRNNLEFSVVGSCEEIALLFFNFLDKKFYLEGREIEIEVFEDNENGASVKGLGKERSKFLLSYGIEQEGRYKGKKTLFVNGDCSFEQIINSIKRKNQIEQIYFGANFQSFLTDFNVIRQIRNEFSSMIITLEIDYNLIKLVDEDILKNKGIHKVIVLKKGIEVDKRFNDVTIKVENEKGIYCFDNYIFNDWASYKDDEILQ